MKKILIIGGILIVLCVAVAGIGAVLGIGLTQPAAAASDGFMSALRDGKYAEAFALCAPELQQELGAAGDLQTMIESNNVQPVSWNFNSREVSGGQGQVQGTVGLSGNRNGTVRLTLADQGGSWKVIGFNISEN